MFNVGILTVSDKGHAGEREDISGKVIKDIISTAGYIVEKNIIVPDEEELIIEQLIYMCDVMKVDLILTTGGTGFSMRDVTPEATVNVCNRMANGISESIRQHSLHITKRAMLSRAVSGIRNQTLIINLPGSPKAVRESLEYILDTLEHGLEILTGKTGECATTNKS